MNKIFIVLLVLASTTSFGQLKTGDKVPHYVFTNVLNGDKLPFDISIQGKPLILEFWATSCSPCIPAMRELESYQKKFGDQLEILTVSTDKLKNLLRYIDNTNTSLRIAHDSIHLNVFRYQKIPHTLLIDKNGIIKAITTPKELTETIIADFIAGKEIEIVKNQITPKNLGLFKEDINQFYHFTLTDENKELEWKNEIKRNEFNEPISLEFNNVSVYRLFTDIYELTSAARLDVNFDSISDEKYCFKLEQAVDYSKGILDNAKEILNENSGFSARLIERTLDSLYTLQVIDSTMLPATSLNEKYNIEGGGPYFKGTNINSNDLIVYLENITERPVKDKTGMNYTFDMELNWSLENPKTLNEQLAKYGIKLKKSSVPEKIVLLEIR